jgi:nucleotide-binding universal stress UspA family protein
MAWPAFPDEEDRRIKIRRQVEGLRADGVDVDLVIRRSHHEAADIIAEIAAELDADVIVCGSRGLSSFSAAFVGSVGQRLLHVAPCPVLVVREPTRVPSAQKETVGA